MFVPIRTAKDFASHVVPGQTTESLTLEFKAALNQNKQGWQVEIARDIAQFANASGGTVLVGVGEVKDARGVGVAASIISVGNPSGAQQQVLQALENHLYPASLPLDITPIDVGSGVVIAINVPPEPEIVVVHHGRCLEFLRRTSHGKAYMTPPEVELHQMNTSRSAQAAIHAALRDLGVSPPKVRVDVIPRPPLAPPTAPLTPMSPYVIELIEMLPRLAVLQFTDTGRSSTGKVHLPYSVIRDAWPTHDSRLGLLLEVQVFPDGGDWAFKRL